MKGIATKAAVTVVVVASVTAALTTPASALPASGSPACATLYGPAGGKLPLCKTWVWDGNDYDGEWWRNGPSTLPSYSYLQRREDGTVYDSPNSGRYHDRDSVLFRVCDSLAGRCSSWW